MRYQILIGLYQAVIIQANRPDVRKSYLCDWERCLHLSSVYLVEKRLININIQEILEPGTT